MRLTRGRIKRNSKLTTGPPNRISALLEYELAQLIVHTHTHILNLTRWARKLNVFGSTISDILNQNANNARAGAGAGRGEEPQKKCV